MRGVLSGILKKRMRRRGAAVLKRARAFAVPVAFWLVFESIAVVLWLALDNVFYLFNFSFIGTCLAVGIALYVAKWRHARRFVQFVVGLYMLVFLGFIEGENMQIEGFWCYLATGVFAGATIHYLVAKIAGPALFGRGWCGYACWTAMVLDLLPYKTRQAERRSWGWMRCVMLVGSVAVSAVLLAWAVDLERALLVAFVVGNVLYYVVGIAMAFVLKDNRAFCKYLCPVALLMKPAAHVSLLRVTCNEERCIECGACKRVCPMDVDMTDNARSRVGATECILCMSCVDACPKKALKP